MPLESSPCESSIAREESPAAADGDMPRACLEPLDPQLTSIQPGGGVCMQIELLWGRVRRAYLKALRRGYLARMANRRRGTHNACPHEVLDPRDVKFYRNQPGGYRWAAEDDPFAWRDRLPLVRYGLAEVVLFSMLWLGLAVAVSFLSPWLAIVPAGLGLATIWFFRNPRRIAPIEAGLVVAPADGRVVSVTEIPSEKFLGGPAVEIGIFLSVFDVHINRAPVASRVIGLTYRPGKFLNALLPASARENEQLAVRLEENDPPHRRYIVRQIAGAIARRIVCHVAPGDDLARGEMFGMIKLGSRTELVLPREPGLVVLATRGQRVRAGTTVLARYETGGREADCPVDSDADRPTNSLGAL